jgi:hypothetical protein
MTRNPVVVAYTEGGLYSPYRGRPAPIRFYGDRTIEDDFIPDIQRKRLTRREWREIRRYARMTPEAINKTRAQRLTREQRLFLMFGKPDVVCFTVTNSFGQSESHRFTRAEIEAMN